MPKGRDWRRGSPRTPETQQRSAEVLRMRQSGHSFEVIAQTLGYRSRQACHIAYKRAMQYTIQEPADELRQLELERLNAREVGLEAREEKLDAWMAKVEVMFSGDEQDDDSKPDSDDALAAFAQLLRATAEGRQLSAERRQIGAERRKLLGLDAPQRIEQQVVTYDGDSELDHEIEGLLTQMADVEAVGEGAPSLEAPGPTGTTST